MSKVPKTPVHEDDSARFQGRVRHYHRKGTGVQSSWEQWIDADKGTRKRNWIKIIFSILGLLVLVAIGVGLWIEMR